MILINLLPHREEKRKRRKIAFFVSLGIAAAAGIAVVLLVMLLLEEMTVQQRQRNEFLNNEIHGLESQIKDIKELRADIDALKARQGAVEDLQSDRNTPVNLLNELARQTPEGVYLTSIKQEDKRITISGIAQTNERVSEFLRNASRGSEWLYQPELVEVKLANLATTGRDQKRLFEFSMRVLIKSTQAMA
ncbi:MAG: PilN domain-containing protein, partial [Paucibacter sp.]|nr:PilN domain-containing protein [Roseateles sp.]